MSAMAQAIQIYQVMAMSSLDTLRAMQIPPDAQTATLAPTPVRPTSAAHGIPFSGIAPAIPILPATITPLSGLMSAFTMYRAAEMYLLDTIPDQMKPVRISCISPIPIQAILSSTESLTTI
jgi:hypothetical protein